MAYTRADIPDLYRQGNSLAKVVELTGVSYPTVRRDLIAAGVQILSRKEGVARHPEGWNSNRIGLRRPEFSEQWRENMRKASAARWEAEGVKGITIDCQGYPRYSAGQYSGQQVHVVIMEARLGRKLLSDEVVHHIDRDKTNYNDNNLALVTNAGHGRLHRFEDRLEGKERKRDQSTGRFQSSQPNI